MGNRFYHWSFHYVDPFLELICISIITIGMFGLFSWVFEIEVESKAPTSFLIISLIINGFLYVLNRGRKLRKLREAETR